MSSSYPCISLGRCNNRGLGRMFLNVNVNPCLRPDPKRTNGAPIPNSASAASTSALVGSASHLSKPSARLRVRIAYWILGLCNNYGYVIMLSAAFDILNKNFHLSDVSGFRLLTAP